LTGDVTIGATGAGFMITTIAALELSHPKEFV
jgi:hypothetical protein